MQQWCSWKISRSSTESLAIIVSGLSSEGHATANIPGLPLYCIPMLLYTLYYLYTVYSRCHCFGTEKIVRQPVFMDSECFSKSCRKCIYGLHPSSSLTKICHFSGWTPQCHTAVLYVVLDFIATDGHTGSNSFFLSCLVDLIPDRLISFTSVVCGFQQWWVKVLVQRRTWSERSLKSEACERAENRVLDLTWLCILFQFVESILVQWLRKRERESSI